LKYSNFECKSDFRFANFNTSQLSEIYHVIEVAARTCGHWLLLYLLQVHQVPC